MLKKLNTQYSLTIIAVIFGISIVCTSCNKTEEVTIERGKDTERITPEQGSLAGAMKKASISMRRLARAVEYNDWDQMDLLTKELKENIGFNCVELYMIENNDIPHEFTVLSSKFNNALNKLMLCGKKQDSSNTNQEFNNLVKSCDACHESFNKDAKTKLDFTDSEQR
ncbi:cytochrome c [Candidatus Scalindua japonica]|nr:cytochrome c [Candidatus Scalindua japonica]